MAKMTTCANAIESLKITRTESLLKNNIIKKLIPTLRALHCLSHHQRIH